MFKISISPSYTAAVKVDLPGDKGKPTTVEFTATFSRLSLTEIEAINVGVADGTIKDRDIIDRVLLGWSGVQDEDGQTLEFNDDNLAVLLAIFPVQPSIVRAYFESLRGAKAKN